jgi:hypothetical protein
MRIFWRKNEEDVGVKKLYLFWFSLHVLLELS